MKNAFLLSLGLLFAVNFAHASLTDAGDVVQDKVSLSCQGQDGRLALTINQSSNTISFSNIEAFGGAQILKDTSFGAEINNGTQVHFEYNWYFTAQYDLTLSKSVGAIVSGDQVNLSLSGDDDDGAFFNDAQFSCKAL